MTAVGDHRSDTELAEFLAAAPLFDHVEPAMRAEVVAAGTPVSLPAGEWLFRQGDAGDALFIVRSGRLEVVVDDGGAGVVVSHLARGDVFGELAVVSGGPRNASIRAVRDTELLRVGREEFWHLSSDRGFVVALITSLGARLAASNVAVEPSVRRQTVLTLHALGSEMPLGDVADALAAEVSGWCSAAIVRAGDFGDQPAGHWARRLDELEHGNDIVVLLAGADAPEAWTRFCARQADRIVAVAAAGTDCAGVDFARPVSDVALFTATPAAAHLRPWRRRFPDVRHHWLRPGAAFDRDSRRLARRLTGTSIGVVLSGGGARGLAHIGVVEALLEAGVVPDRFGGTSMGAFVAALFAMERTPAEVREICRQELVLRRPFADWTLPRHALIRGTRGEMMFRRVFGDAQADELACDWFAVSTDLMAADQVIHRRGYVRDAIRTSMGLPGLAPPVLRDDHLLVDGGVLNNLPVDVMAAAGEGPVVAVDVMRQWHDRWEGHAGVESTLSTLYRRLRRLPPRPPLPSIAETIASVTSMGSARWSDANRRLADLLVGPELSDFELLEWERIDAIVQRGLLAGRQAVADGLPWGRNGTR